MNCQQANSTLLIEFICIDPICTKRGLLDQNNDHKDHFMQPLTLFIEQYKEILNSKTQMQTLNLNSEEINYKQFKIRQNLLSLQQTLNKEIENVLFQLDNIFKNYQSILENTKQLLQKYNKNIIYIEDQLKLQKPNQQLIKIALDQLISRITYDSNYNISKNKFKLADILQDQVIITEKIKQNTDQLQQTLDNENSQYMKGIRNYLSSIIENYQIIELNSQSQKQTQFQSPGKLQQFEYNQSNSKISPIEKYNVSPQNISPILSKTKSSKDNLEGLPSRQSLDINFNFLPQTSFQQIVKEEIKMQKITKSSSSENFVRGNPHPEGNTQTQRSKNQGVHLKSPAITQQPFNWVAHESSVNDIKSIRHKYAKISQIK